jgi:hypothetical protein
MFEFGLLLCPVLGLLQSLFEENIIGKAFGFNVSPIVYEERSSFINACWVRFSRQ